MIPKLPRTLLAMAVAVSALLTGAGTANAYLSKNGQPFSPGPGDTPDYFTTFNWAFSPLPTGSVAINVVNGGSGYTNPTVTITDDLSVSASGATATATVDPTTGAITAINVTNAGSGYVHPVVTISDPTGSGAVVEASISNPTGGIRKFVDTLPLLTPAGANNLGQYLPVAVPDTTTYPGSDYYEIGLVQYTKKVHSDLAPTTFRGYVQLNNGTDTTSCGGQGQPACTTANNTVAPDPNPNFLGPVIVAQRDRPVRIKFVNMLPTGADGDLFIPVDTTVMGSGPYQIDYDPVTKQPKPLTNGVFTQNRGLLHLHGGLNPWISDGTPHQWITPAGEVTDYPKGVGVVNVPDMPDPGDGAQTYYWTNQQSARLMFYHDHSWGITRLNVYVGEAAGYIIRDDIEQQLIAAGVLPTDEIPLILTEKTFVDPNTITKTDPTWRWGTGPFTVTGNDGNLYREPKQGDLWWPHVFMPAQNPWDPTAVAPYGRWPIASWFYPTPNVAHPPVPNPYYEAACFDAVNAGTADETTPGFHNGFCQPPEIPGTPDVSTTAESFLDTPMVNGTAYPVLEVQPKAYRFRILNASNDRFFNLQLYKADPTVPAGCPTCATNTEVKMVPAIAGQGEPASWAEAMDAREGGVPDWTAAGPNWIEIGTESGFLPKPVVVENKPVIYELDPTLFAVGNVKDGTMILGPAERADVIIDFSQYAGQTLILYNDAPAAYPASDPHYDFYTGNPDMTEAGGAPSTLPGFGPNTRTIMQIKVANTTPAQPYDVQALQNAFQDLNGNGSVFEQDQPPLIVGQDHYNGIYKDASGNPVTFPSVGPNNGKPTIHTGITTPLEHYDANGQLVSHMPLQKGMHDEQGEMFDDYGRLRGSLGMQSADMTIGLNGFINMPFPDIATEIIDPNAGDGVQIWRFTHNGVDTHPIHFHLFDVQMLGSVAWDGFFQEPMHNQLGWKDTIRFDALEDTFVALRPKTPALPFGLPESVRPLNPAEPIGSTRGFTQVDAQGNPLTPPRTNEWTNFDWEYVFHCHILNHEENDMMRPVVFQFAETVPAAPGGLSVSANAFNRVDLTWTDPTPAVTPVASNPNLGNGANEIGYRIERSSDGGNTFTTIGNALANATSFTDTSVQSGTDYVYKVVAYNAAGESAAQSTVITAQGVNLAADVPSPQQVGTAITFNASLINSGGGSGTGVEYEFRKKDPSGTWTVVQPYSASSTYAWTTTSADVGRNVIQVLVRSAGSTAFYEAKSNMYYYVTPIPATGVSLSADVASPGTVGTTVTFTAAGQGGSGTYEYEFRQRDPSGTWTVVQPYSASSTYAWTTTSADVGKNVIQVRVRSAGSTAFYEAKSNMAYYIQ